MISIGFFRNQNNQVVYYLNFILDKVITNMYVDDLIIIGRSKIKIEEFKKKMMIIFEMTNLRLLSSHLGIDKLGFGVFLMVILNRFHAIKYF